MVGKHAPEAQSQLRERAGSPDERGTHTATVLRGTQSCPSPEGVGLRGSSCKGCLTVEPAFQIRHNNGTEVCAPKSSEEGGCAGCELWESPGGARAPHLHVGDSGAD